MAQPSPHGACHSPPLARWAEDVCIIPAPARGSPPGLSCPATTEQSWNSGESGLVSVSSHALNSQPKTATKWTGSCNTWDDVWLV